MTAITQNLPWFIKDLGISIVGDECYTSLVENLDIGDVKCLKYSLSKGLGIGIVVGGSIMKVPQILLILNARSARGLSLEAYILETLSYAITLAYSFRNQFPFSTYGENLFLTLQNVLITLLIISYAPTSRTGGQNKSQKIVLAILGTVASGFALYAVPPGALSFLQMTTLPLSLFSKLPQIRQNYRSRSTGQLSAFAVVSQIAGCVARLFTTATEVGDSLVAAGFALALVLNLVLGAQLWLYWGDKDVTEEFGLTEVQQYQKEKESGYSPVSAASATWDSSHHVHQPIATTATSIGTATHRVSTPPPRAQTPTSAGGRKWARKID